MMTREICDYETEPARVKTFEEKKVCRMLRTKKAYGSFVGQLYDWDEGESSTAVFWCLRTMGTAGPDDNFAHAHTCKEGRYCFETEGED